MSDKFQLLNLFQVQQKTTLSRAGVYRELASDSFPRPVQLSPGRGRRIAFVAAEVDDWIAARVAARNGGVR